MLEFPTRLSLPIYVHCVTECDRILRLSSTLRFMYRTEIWIGCFPSSTFKPETLDAVRHDEVLIGIGKRKKTYLEMGWFDVAERGTGEPA